MKVYQIEPNQYCYSGFALVGAPSARSANEFIEQFKSLDKNNMSDSYGYGFVDEDDAVEGLFATQPGIIIYGIYYSG